MVFRNPNGYSSTSAGDWPLYTYPERAHIVLDVFNKSTGVAHRADYCHFWEQYVPILLEEFGKSFLSRFLSFHFLLERCVIHGPSSSSLTEKSSNSSSKNSFLHIFFLFIILLILQSNN